MTDYNQWEKVSEEKINVSQNKNPSISNIPRSKHPSLVLSLVIHSRHRFIHM